MDRLIAELDKNHEERLRISVRDYQGHTYVDIRLYFLGDDDSWHPTKRGVTVSPSLWSEFLEALGQVQAQLPATGKARPRASS